MQVLKVSLINSFIMKIQKSKLHEHRANLKQLINAGQVLLASHQDCRVPLMFPHLTTESRRARRSRDSPIQVTKSATLPPDAESSVSSDYTCQSKQSLSDYQCFVAP